MSCTQFTQIDDCGGDSSGRNEEEHLRFEIAGSFPGFCNSAYAVNNFEICLPNRWENHVYSCDSDGYFEDQALY